MGDNRMLEMTHFTPDPARFAEFLACLWQGTLPPDLRLHKWLYLPGEPRAMLLVWEGGPDAQAYIDRAFGSFGELRSESVTDATPGMAAAFARDLNAFGDFLRESQGASESHLAAQLDLRRRGLEAPDLEAAAAAGRQWKAEQDRTPDS
jgi:hypothetical protein